MNAFEKHGINHLSASSLNTYAASPALWVMERLLKRSAPVGCSAHRGTSIEEGVSHGLLNPAAELKECQTAALRKYDSLTALNGDPNREKERDGIESSVAIALEELKQYGVPDEMQTKINVTLPGVSVPLLGFLDFGWSDHGITLDLKTTWKCPSEITPSHARQVAIYVHGTNRQGRVAYVTPKRMAVYGLENPSEHIAALTQIAQRMERFLALSGDVAELAGILVPDYENFRFNSVIARNNAREVFGF